MKKNNDIVVYCKGNTDLYCICLENNGVKLGYRIATDAEEASYLAIDAEEAASDMYENMDYLPEWVHASPRFIVNGEKIIDDYISFWHEELWSEIIFRQAENIEGVDIREVPSWALPYFVNGDMDGLSEEDMEAISDMEQEFTEITHWSQEPYFSGYEEVYKCIVTLAN